MLRLRFDLLHARDVDARVFAQASDGVTGNFPSFRQCFTGEEFNL